MKTFALDRRVPDDELAMWIKRVARLLVVATLAFAAFYAVDRWRPASPPIIDQHVAALEAAVRKDPNDIASRGLLADAYVAKGRYQDAVTQYTAIIDAKTNLEPAYLGRAAAYMGLDQLDAAAKDYQAVVDLAIGGEMANVDPTLESAYYGLGSIAMKQNRPADAVTQLEKALAITRSDADAMYLIGTAFIATGQLEKAVTELRASIVFVPVGWSEPYTALADAYTKAGQSEMAAWAKAMADLASGKPDAAEPALKALVGGPAAIDAAVGLGLLYETKGQGASAYEWYSKALQLQPENNAARLGIGRVGPMSSALPSVPGVPSPNASEGSN